MRRFILTAKLALLTLFAAFSFGQSQTQTGLEGIIQISPTRAGPIRADTPPFRPFPNAAFVVQNEKKDIVGTFTTDDQGHFSIALEPGHYTVVKKGDKPAIGNFGPFEVEIVAGKTTKVEWQCDSGVR